MVTLVKAIEEISKKRKELQEQVKTELKAGIAEFMKEHPEIGAIRWTQYTPYFNDGDTCEFSLHEVEMSVNKEQGSLFESDSNYDEDDWASLEWGKKPAAVEAKTWEEAKGFAKALHKVEDDLQFVFGDHVRVVVSRTGIDIDEYEHD